MSDIRKLLDIINETTVAGSVATVAAPMSEVQKRVEETATEETSKPEVIEYGMWENSALTTTSKLKKNRGKSAKVVKSIYGEAVQSEAANPKQQAAIAIAKKKEVAEGKFTVNAKTGAKLNPRTGAELPPKEKPLTMKDMFSQPKSTAPKLTLDAVWRKVEDVVGQIFPDGDPIDYLAPWLEKHGIRDFKIGEILDRAAKKNGYEDLYDYYDSMKDQYARDNVAEGYNDISVGDYVSYDDGPGTDRWEVVSIEGNRVELRNDQGGTTFADINDILKEQGVAEGLHGGDDYTLGNPVDKEYVYQVWRTANDVRDYNNMGKWVHDGGTTHSLADAKRRKDALIKGTHGVKAKIVRVPRSQFKLAGPQGHLPEEQGVAESALEESDLILNPASLSKPSRDLVSHDHDRTDHEVEMAKGDLYQAGKNAVKIFELIKDKSEEEGLEGWVQEKIIKANDYLNTIREYLEGKQMESMDGVAPGTKMFTSEEKPGLWANIHAKRKRIKSGSGERMREPGSKGAPSAQDFKNSAK